MTKLDEWRGGWSVVAASFLGMMLSSWTLPFYLLGPITMPLTGAFGWSQGDLAISASCLSIGATAGAILFGRVADQFDLSRVIMISLGAFGLSLLAAAAIQSLWQVYLFYFLAGLLGAGCGSITYTRAIGARFGEARGFALGIALCGTGFAAFVVPLLAYAVSSAWGWNAVFLVLGAVILLFGLPAIHFGLGSTRATASSIAPAEAIALEGMTRSEALRDPRFWLVMVAVCLFGLFITSLIINIVPMLLAQGISAGRAAGIASLLGIATVTGRLAVGFLLDRLPANLIGAGTFAIGTLGALLFAVAGGDYAMMTVILIGLLVGAETDLLAFMALRYFGVRHYGQIYGLLYGAYTLFSMTSPLIGAALVGQGGHRWLFGMASLGFGLATLTCLIMMIVAPERAGGRRLFGSRATQ